MLGTMTSAPPADAVDGSAFGLRHFLQSLPASEMERRPEAVDLADIAGILEGNPRAVWFGAAGPEGAELVGNVVGSRARIAAAFGVAPADLLAELLRRLRLPPRLREVARDAAPVQQIVQTGKDVDLTALPLHLQHAMDGGLFFSGTVDFVRDPRSGRTNVGVRRLMLRGPRETGIDLLTPSDMRVLYQGAMARGEDLPVSFVVGCHPIDLVAATMRLPGDELELISSLRAAELPVVKGITNDILVPADAEYVLEGFISAAGYTESEGPFGEFLGYYGGVKSNPVFHCTAITRRADALFQTVTISGRSMANTDTGQLMALRTEALAWRSLEAAIREPLAVHATAASGGMFTLRISMRQHAVGEARNAIAAAFASVANVKNVFVVDPDIDIFSDQEMDWALATRFQADRDLVVEGGFRTPPLDPSLHGGLAGAKAGFDLTWPYGMAERLERHVPAPPGPLDLPRHDDVESALCDGPKTFAEVMACTGSRDGREIVRAIDGLRRAGRLGRGEAGRWAILPVSG